MDIDGLKMETLGLTHKQIISSSFQDEQARQQSTPGEKLADYEVLAELGHGTHGECDKVRSRRDGNIYVMKRIRCSHLPPEKQKRVLVEVLLLKRIDHPHVIGYHTSFVEGKSLHIIMEYASNGDLQSELEQHKNNKTFLPENRLWQLLCELSSALQYLHERKIIHRDIKIGNVFLDADNHVKLGDLGASTILEKGEEMARSRVGTPLYLAPELIKRQPYDFKADVWALGVLMYTMAAQKGPFLGDNIYNLGYTIVHDPPQPLPPNYSSAFINLILSMIEKVPLQRPSMDEVLSQARKNSRAQIPGLLAHVASNITSNKTSHIAPDADTASTQTTQALWSELEGDRETARVQYRENHSSGVDKTHHNKAECGIRATQGASTHATAHRTLSEVHDGSSVSAVQQQAQRKGRTMSARHGFDPMDADVRELCEPVPKLKPDTSSNSHSHSTDVPPDDADAAIRSQAMDLAYAMFGSQRQMEEKVGTSSAHESTVHANHKSPPALKSSSYIEASFRDHQDNSTKPGGSTLLQALTASQPPPSLPTVTFRTEPDIQVGRWENRDEDGRAHTARQLKGYTGLDTKRSAGERVQLYMPWLQMTSSVDAWGGVLQPEYLNETVRRIRPTTAPAQGRDANARVVYARPSARILGRSGEDWPTMSVESSAWTPSPPKESFRPQTARPKVGSSMSKSSSTPSSTYNKMPKSTTFGDTTYATSGADMLILHDEDGDTEVPLRKIPSPPTRVHSGSISGREPSPRVRFGDPRAYAPAATTSVQHATDGANHTNAKSRSADMDDWIKVKYPYSHRQDLGSSLQRTRRTSGRVESQTQQKFADAAALSRNGSQPQVLRAGAGQSYAEGGRGNGRSLAVTIDTSQGKSSRPWSAHLGGGFVRVHGSVGTVTGRRRPGVSYFTKPTK